MFALRLVAVLPVCMVLTSAEVMNVHIDGNTKLCNTTHTVGKDTVTIVSKGNIPGANCKLTFTTQEANCGICFQFEKYAFFNSSMAGLDVTAGSKTVMINSMKEFPMESICSDSNKMVFTLMHESGYVYDPNEPGYMFTLDIFNKCGYRGSASSVTFEDVKGKAKGYHHGEEKESREQQTLITGLVVALCLASVFLIILLVAYCYVKNSPNRGASKSVGMPKVGGKKGMDVGHAEEGRKPDVEMTAYKSKGADRPEGKPLLTGAAVSAALVKEEKRKVKKERKGSASSASSASSDDHGDQQAEEKKQLIEPTQETTEPSKDTSEPTVLSGGESGYGGGSSDYTSGGGSSNLTSGGGSSDYTSGGGSSDYTSGGGGGYSGGYSSYSGGGGGSSCGGGGSSCGGGGGGGSDD